MASAEKRVTTYLPNCVLGKMDGGQPAADTCRGPVGPGRRAALFRRRVCVSGRGGAVCADLGGSSMKRFSLKDEGSRSVLGGESAVETEAP